MASIGTFGGQQGSNDFVGINESGMANLKGDLQALEKGVENILDTMTTAVSMNDAFKGEELQGAVKRFVDSVKTEGKEWASRINEYCARIDTVLEAMKRSQSQLASGLDSSTKSVSSQTTGYTYGGGSSSAS